MKSTSVRRVILPGIAALALAMTGCSAGNEDSGGNSDDSSGLSGTLAGGGSTAQEAAQGVWVAKFQTTNPDSTITYDAVGSGGGRESFISGAFAFAGSDASLTSDESKQATDNCGSDVVEVPNYVSPIAIIFNIDGVDSLQLSPDTLAGIMTGEITKWDDPKIAADNPDATLPSAAINAVHRSDESGTTENFTDYLNAVAPDVWTAGVVQTWPDNYGGEGAKGTSGVVAAVKGGKNSIGYADASQAGDLGMASIKVGDAYVEPSADAASKILEVSKQADTGSDTELAFDIDHTTSEAGVYPIVMVSYIMACQMQKDSATGDLVKGYLSYVVSTEGQQAAADEAGSAPLPSSIQSQAADIVDKISVS